MKTAIRFMLGFFIGVVLALASIRLGHAASTDTINIITYSDEAVQPVPVEQKIVEIHMTRNVVVALEQSKKDKKKRYIEVVPKKWGDLLLLDCSALPGNSGGPVFNQKGELVGVLNAGFIVGMGVTHLNMAQGLDTVHFFIKEVAYRYRDGRR